MCKREWIVELLKKGKLGNTSADKEKQLVPLMWRMAAALGLYNQSSQEVLQPAALNDAEHYDIAGAWTQNEDALGPVEVEALADPKAALGGVADDARAGFLATVGGLLVRFDPAAGARAGPCAALHASATVLPRRECEREGWRVLKAAGAPRTDCRDGSAGRERARHRCSVRVGGSASAERRVRSGRPDVSACFESWPEV